MIVEYKNFVKKLLLTYIEGYQYLGAYLVNIDGTGQFASSNVSCKDCCSRYLRNGEKQYYHQLLGAVIVHPSKSNVLPLFPEAITRQDGESKNDCERNASKRLLATIREDFPKLKMIVGNVQIKRHLIDI